MATAIQPHDSLHRSNRSAPSTQVARLLLHVSKGLRALDAHWVHAESVDGCHCATCEKRRCETFKCNQCGYLGTPTVYASNCWDHAQDDIAFWEEKQAEELANPTDRHAQRLRFIARRMKEAREQRPCPSASPRTRCAHGAVECPVCGDGDLYNNDIDPWRLVREARAELRAIRQLLI